MQFHELALNAPLKNIFDDLKVSSQVFFTFTGFMAANFVALNLLLKRQFTLRTLIYSLLLSSAIFTIYIDGGNGILSLPRQRQIIIILFASIEVAQVQATFISLSLERAQKKARTWIFTFWPEVERRNVWLQCCQTLFSYIWTLQLSCPNLCLPFVKRIKWCSFHVMTLRFLSETRVRHLISAPIRCHIR